MTEEKTPVIQADQYKGTSANAKFKLLDERGFRFQPTKAQHLQVNRLLFGSDHSDLCLTIGSPIEELDPGKQPESEDAHK